MDLVIKVKYGDNLRRFNSYINGDSMDLDMDKLRAKVIDLFKLHPDCDLTLTYADEDNDIVTLADDNDLRDAVLTQRLNPLRINVLLKTSRATTSETRSKSGAPTPIQSPQVPSSPAPRVSAGIEEAVKALPEPLRDPLLKLSDDFLSKASASVPALTELVEYLTKVGQSRLSPDSHSQDGPTLNKHAGEPSPNLNIPVVSGVSDDPLSIPNMSPNTSSVDQIPADVVTNNGANKVEGAGTSVPPGTSVNLNLELPKDPFVSGWSLLDGSFMKADIPPKDDSEIQKESEGHQSEKSQPEIVSVDPLVDLGHPDDPELHIPTPPEANSQAYAMDGAKFWWQRSPGVSGWENSCPFKVRYGADGAGSWVWNHSFGAPHRSSYGPHDSFPRAFHRGVRCDGCGMHPIVGPRFKSKVKEDYDLCNVCFSEMGNEADYSRIDRASYQTPRSRNPFQGPPTHLAHGRGMRPLKAKLESRFVLDVNVLDGTLMPPGTHFTKIWRMRNDGTIVWPHGTKLVYICGDRFANSDSVGLQIPESGYPVGGELDVAVDFTAPKKPGRYGSYWMMASPSGQRFGQRVWVVIQVGNLRSEFTPDNHATLNLNLPPENNRIKVKAPAIMIDMNVEPKDSIFSEPDPYGVSAAQVDLEVAGINNSFHGNNATAAPAVPKEGTNPSSIPKEVLSSAGAYPSSVSKEVPSSAGANPSSVLKEVPASAGASTSSVPKEVLYSAGANTSSFPREVSSAGATGTKLPSVSKEGPPSAGATRVNPSPNPKEAASSLYPTIDLSQPAVTADEVPPPVVSGIDAFEMTLLKELEAMGFKDMDLNKKILWKNDYDLAQSLDDLCGFSEWELLLNDLEEMGFPDREMNLKLLQKNGGSIKRAVLDLISGERA